MKQKLGERATRLGADLIGVARVEGLDGVPRGHHPLDILPNAKSAIVLAIKMLDAQTDLLPTSGDFFTESPRQAMFVGHSGFVSQELDRIGYAVSRFLEKEDFKAYHQMASTGGTDRRYLMGLLSLKHLAVQAGLGVFGRHSLLITPEYGPRVRLTAIVTDAELEPDAPLDRDFCSGCEKPCISLCPAGALEEPDTDSAYQINKFACSQYLNTRPTCSICLKVCPIGESRTK